MRDPLEAYGHLKSSVTTMVDKIVKYKREQLRREKWSVFEKAHELGKLYDIDIAIIIKINGRYFTCRSLDKESWPPTIKEIVSPSTRTTFLDAYSRAVGFLSSPSSPAPARYRG